MENEITQSQLQAALDNCGKNFTTHQFMIELRAIVGRSLHQHEKAHSTTFLRTHDMLKRKDGFKTKTFTKINPAVMEADPAEHMEVATKSKEECILEAIQLLKREGYEIYRLERQKV